MIKRLLFVLALLFAVMQASAQTYTYDNLNRLTKVVYDNDVTVTYTYDALGNRTKKTVTGASDPKEAYAWLSNDSTILTFCYDSDREERVGTTYNLNEDYNYPDWNPNPWGSPRDAITSVVFDSSFAQARPVSTYCWFFNLSKLTEITGLRYLNTSNVKNMVCMFYGCSGLTSLDVSNFDTENVTDMASLFYGCSSLSNLDVSNFNTAKVTDMQYMFYYCSELTSLDVSNFNTAKVTNMEYMFCGCHDLKIIDVSRFNTEEVRYFAGMFYGCNSLENLDVSNFNTDNVTSMSFMFASCNRLTNLDVSNFNTVNVTSMSGMFYYCSGLTSLDVSNFDTENVTDMMDLFHDCSNLRNLDVSNFNTANVTDMTQMFWGCSSLTSLDVSNFNTDNLTSMSSMFAFCNRLTSLDLSNFNTAIVNDMTQMFLSCSELATIYADDDWSTTAVTWSTNMFSGCTSLVGGKGTLYDANHTDATYAHIDSGPSDPGYFTAASTLLPGDVDGDGKVNIDDLTALIDILLRGSEASGNADVDGDGKVGIDDVTALIDYLLKGSWPDEPVPPSDEHEYVDLGLPSGTLWATMNVGANAPEEYGDYFAWGETAPKDYYDWSTYKWCNGSQYTLTKYCSNSSYGYNGFTDSKTELDPEDDAITVNWGSSWRTPTTEQQQELIDNCTWTWTMMNDVNGYQVTGSNGNSIFLPAAGYRYSGSLYCAGSDGEYWLRVMVTSKPYFAHLFYFVSGYQLWNQVERYYGLTVRAVRASQD